MRFGTSHFTATRCAIAYYEAQGYDADDVKRKLEDGEISIGKPSHLVGERAIIDNEGRYWIEAQT